MKLYVKIVSWVAVVMFLLNFGVMWSSHPGVGISNGIDSAIWVVMMSTLSPLIVWLSWKAGCAVDRWREVSDESTKSSV